MKFAYQNRGNVSPSWAKGYPPAQARSADCKSLGAYEYVPNYALPGAPEVIHGVMDTVNNVQGIAGAAFAGYHGFLRSGRNLGWAAVWAAAGAFAPFITGAVALYQGYGGKK